MKNLSQFLARAENAVHFIDIFDMVPYSFNCTKHNLLKSIRTSPKLSELAQSKNHLGLTFTNGSHVEVENKGVSGWFPSASRQVEFQTSLGRNKIEHFHDMPVMYETLGLMKDRIARCSKLPRVMSLSQALTHPHISVSHDKIEPFCKAKPNHGQDDLELKQA